MKTFVRACLLALPLLAASTASRAQAWGLPVQFDAGINAHCNSYWGGANMGPTAGPWYSYFPYQAHFQTPAPIGGWPYWPTSAAAARPAPPSLPTTGSMYRGPVGAQPASYQGMAPSYWFGR
jgi:hypothetical protein